MSTNAAAGGAIDDGPLRTGSGASGFATGIARRIQSDSAGERHDDREDEDAAKRSADAHQRSG